MPRDDIWEEYERRAWDRLQAGRAALGYVKKPSPPWISSLIRGMPNLFLVYANKAD